MTVKHPNRWSILWAAIVTWWRNEPPVPPPPDLSILKQARKFLIEYDELYCERTKTPSAYANQAASIIAQEGLKRSPTITSEVRVLAIALERMITHLEKSSEAR